MGIGSSHKLVGCLSGTRTCAMSEGVDCVVVMGPLASPFRSTKRRLQR